MVARALRDLQDWPRATETQKVRRDEVRAQHDGIGRAAFVGRVVRDNSCDLRGTKSTPTEEITHGAELK